MSGNIPISKHLLKAFAKYGEIIGDKEFKNLLGIFSGPLAFSDSINLVQEQLHHLFNTSSLVN